MMSELPRVLFLTGEPPHTAAAGAIFFHRLFHDWSAENLLVVTNNPPPAGAGLLPCRYEHLQVWADRLHRTRFWPWRNALSVLGAPGLPGPDRIDSALAGFKPDLVATLMQDSWYYILAARYARARRLPLVVLVHDLPDGFEPVPSWLRARQQRRDAAVYRQAAQRFCISSPMRDHFQETFGVGGEVLLPPRSEETVTQQPEACAHLKQPGRLVLGYAGGLHYGYGEQLLRLLPMLRETGTRLECYSPRPSGVVSALAEATDIISFHDYAPTPGEALRGLLERCDAVLQPYLNPAGAHEQQYRTHFPSKLGDYLALGLPLVITGPEFASGVAWCQAQNEPACVVTNPAPSAFAAALLQLRNSATTRISLARRAQSAAAAFAARPLRARFLQQLRTASTFHA